MMLNVFCRLNSARRTILLVIALLLCPFLLASALYWFEWRPATLSNHGMLIQPPKAMPENGLRQLGSAQLPPPSLRGKWLLVLVNPASCELECVQALQQSRQVQVSLNKEMVRLQRVLLITGAVHQPLDSSVFSKLHQQFPDLLLLRPDDTPQGVLWRETLQSNVQRFYVVDPLGNAMMVYPEKFDVQGMRQDLERLLKYSWIG
ncbi:MAG: hypothetical protein V4623_08095 [Pseudomonadota bacterium]